MAKISDEVAREFMLQNGLKPLEAYPGGHKPWKCECLKCGRKVSPHYSSVQQGRKGCAYCAGRKVDAVDAVQLMLASKLEPLEDFPGAKKKWKCRCLGCNQTVYPQYGNIRAGSGGCKMCAGLYVEPQVAKIFFESLGYRVLENYPGAAEPWRAQCLKCNNFVSPRYSDLRNGKSRGCEYCGGSKVNPKEALDFLNSKGFTTSIPFPGAMTGWKGVCTTCRNDIYPKYSAVKAGQGVCKFCAGRALSERDAMVLLQNANLEPLETYTKASNKIRCKCTVCHRTVGASLMSLAQGHSGCAYCAGKKVDADEALLVMRDSGFEALENYPGSKTPWKCKCVQCGKISTPTYGNVALSGSGCIYCNRDNGAFDGSTSGLIYLITNSQLNSHKIGITSRERKSDRLKVHRSSGWKVFETLEFDDGSEVLRIERAVLDWARKELNLGPHLSREEVPQGGFSETLDASEIDPETIWAKVQELSKNDDC